MEFLTEMQGKSFLSRMVSKSSDAQRLDELTKEIEDAMSDLQTDLLAELAVAANEIKDRRDEREAVVTSAKQEEANLSVMKQRVQEKVGLDESTGEPSFNLLKPDDIAAIAEGLPFDQQMLRDELSAHLEEIKQGIGDLKEGQGELKAGQGEIKDGQGRIMEQMEQGQGELLGKMDEMLSAMQQGSAATLPLASQQQFQSELVNNPEFFSMSETDLDSTVAHQMQTTFGQQITQLSEEEQEHVRLVLTEQAKIMWAQQRVSANDAHTLTALQQRLHTTPLPTPTSVPVVTAGSNFTPAPIVNDKELLQAVEMLLVQADRGELPEPAAVIAEAAKPRSANPIPEPPGNGDYMYTDDNFDNLSEEEDLVQVHVAQPARAAEQVPSGGRERVEALAIRNKEEAEAATVRRHFATLMLLCQAQSLTKWRFVCVVSPG
eukprot:COSAG06_NODE_151_length_21964_cov_95.963961_14_plen_433_part_00